MTDAMSLWDGSSHTHSPRGGTACLCHLLLLLRFLLLLIVPDDGGLEYIAESFINRWDSGR